MATRKDRKTRPEPKPKEGRPRSAVSYPLPSAQERLTPYVPGRYQVAMGTGEEVADWLRAVPATTRGVLIAFETEACYETYGPFLWYVAQNLPEIAAEIQRRKRLQRRKFEEFVDALTQDLLDKQGNPTLLWSKSV